MNEELQDRLIIRELIENWVLWRDARMWDKFRTVWHDDGRMMATWAQGTAEEFIENSINSFANGMRVMHLLGGSSIEVEGKRAIAQTKMTILQRALVHGILCDVACIGRFYDFLEKREGRWGIVLRQPIYEKDRMDPVDPEAKLHLDPKLLTKYPEGYRHLAYLQAQIGFNPKLDMPGHTGPEIEALYMRGANWLSGAELPE
ncbi:MAG: nuclear transport factor 2 family protein [Alloacidobacterium sp.]